MDQTATNVSAQDHAFELARWYHELAKMCLNAAEYHISLGEESTLQDVDRAMALNEVVRMRMATVQSVERVFRSEFQRLYIDHHVERILLASEADAAS
jgi:GTP1/Obg family GTP-binding protein